MLDRFSTGPCYTNPIFNYGFIGCLFNVTAASTFQQEESELSSLGGNNQLLTLGLGLLATALAATYVTKLAKVLSCFPYPN